MFFGRFSCKITEFPESRKNSVCGVDLEDDEYLGIGGTNGTKTKLDGTVYGAVERYTVVATGSGMTVEVTFEAIGDSLSPRDMQTLLKNPHPFWVRIFILHL